METEPIIGVPARFSRGRVTIHLSEEYRRPYQELYTHYRTVIDDLPVLRERDFDGRPVMVTASGLVALNQALANLGGSGEPSATSAFGAQARAKSRLFKKLQYLS
jgi:hypothetical protein